MADPAANIVQFTEDQFKALLASLAPKPGVVVTAAKKDVATLVAEAQAAAGGVVAEVKAIHWSHVASFIMAAAALALHFVHLPL